MAFGQKPPKPGPDYVWDSAANAWVYKPPVTPTPAATPTATKQTAATAGAGMGTGGKTYDQGNPGAGGIPGQGVAPAKPTNPYRAGSLQADRWDQDHKAGIYAPGSTTPQYASTPAATPSTVPIPGAMTAAQMDAMQAPGATQTATAVTRKDGDPGPVAGTVWSSKDNAYVMPAATTTTPPVTTTNTNTSASTNTGQTTTNPVTQTTQAPQEGWTRTEGGKTFKFTGGKWVDSADADRMRFTGGTPAFNEQPVTIPTTGQETPMAAQRPDNAASNALALARDVNQEFAMPDYSGVANEQINAGNAIIDRTLQQGLADQDNRYMGGPGVTGARIRQRQQTMEDAGLQKANYAQGVRNHYTDLTANLNEARRNSTLGAGLDQNRLQVGTVQQERDRAEGRDRFITGLRHEAGTAEAAANKAEKQDFMKALLGYVMPEPIRPDQQAAIDLAHAQMAALGQTSGVNYNPQAAYTGGAPAGIAGGIEGLLSQLGINGLNLEQLLPMLSMGGVFR